MRLKFLKFERGRNAAEKFCIGINESDLIAMSSNCFEYIKFTIEDLNPKLRNITTIYSQDLIRYYLQKILKTPTREAWNERYGVLLRERCEAQALGEGFQNCSTKIRECFV